MTNFLLHSVINVSDLPWKWLKEMNLLSCHKLLMWRELNRGKESSSCQDCDRVKEREFPVRRVYIDVVARFP